MSNKIRFSYSDLSVYTDWRERMISDHPVIYIITHPQGLENHLRSILTLASIHRPRLISKCTVIGVLWV